MQSQLKLCMVGLKLLIAVLSPAIAGAETYYVANNGVDANIGSIERPFATVMHAQEVASPSRAAPATCFADVAHGSTATMALTVLVRRKR